MEDAGEDGDVAAGVEVLMATSKVLTAVVARSLILVQPSVTTPQLRVLVMLNSLGSLNLNAVAQRLGVDASNASRTCEQLVAAKLVLRRTDPDDRRNIVLRLSTQGSSLAAKVMQERQAVFTRIVDQLKHRDLIALTHGLGAFLRTVEDSAAADGGVEPALFVDESDLLGWLT